MQTLNFISLRGTQLTGKVHETKKLKGLTIHFVVMLSKVFAITDNYEVDEMPIGGDQRAFETSIINQL